MPKPRPTRITRGFLSVLILGPVVAMVVSLLAVHGRAIVEAATLNIPHSFTPNTTIQSSQMNANFSAVRDVVNALDDANLTNASITGSLKLIDQSVTTPKIADNAITSAKILNDAVTATKIPDGSLGSVELANGAATAVGGQSAASGTTVTLTGSFAEITTTGITTGTTARQLEALIQVYLNVEGVGGTCEWEWRLVRLGSPDTTVWTSGPHKTGSGTTEGDTQIVADFATAPTVSTTYSYSIRARQAAGAGTCDVKAYRALAINLRR